jgi:hypothetical protein
MSKNDKNIKGILPDVRFQHEFTPLYLPPEIAQKIAQRKIRSNNSKDYGLSTAYSSPIRTLFLGTLGTLGK